MKYVVHLTILKYCLSPILFLVVISTWTEQLYSYTYFIKNNTGHFLRLKVNISGQSQEVALNPAEQKVVKGPRSLCLTSISHKSSKGKWKTIEWDKTKKLAGGGAAAAGVTGIPTGIATLSYLCHDRSITIYTNDKSQLRWKI